MELITRVLSDLGVAHTGGRIYMDNAATTRIDPAARSAMMDCMCECWGNPSAPYEEGKRAKYALEWSRDIFSKGLRIPPADIVFTSCGTESNNIAVRCVMNRQKAVGRDLLVISAVEHSSIRKTASHCGCRSVQVKVDDRGIVLQSDFEAVLTENRDKVGMVSIILGQNEVGSIQDVKSLVSIARGILGDAFVPFHTDATQAVGKIPVDFADLGVDLMTASAHKFHGPRGVGILCTRPGILDDEGTTMTGGGQEGGRRSGTENVPAIVGAAMAFSIATENGALERSGEHMRRLRKFMVASIRQEIPGVVFNSEERPEFGLPNIVNFCMPGDELHGHDVVEEMDKKGVSLNSGSACSKGKEPSETLISMGRSRELAHSAVRISFSRHSTIEDCRRVVSLLGQIYRSKKHT